MILPAAALLLALAGEEMASAEAAGIEGRPSAQALSPLQTRVDAAPEGSVVEVGPGTYRGDLYVDRRVTVTGRGRPRLLGSGTGSVVRIRAAGVVLDGFDIDGGGGGDLGRDSSGIHVAAKNVTIRDCRVSNALFGVYLREADGSSVERTSIRGIPGKDPGEKGSGIHVWNTNGFRLVGNTIEDVRDGFYIQSSSHGVIRGNTARDLRYGLHYMFTDDNLFEDNTFENGAAGTAIMYSKRIVFRRNRFLHNRGFASVGLLFKSCEDVTAESNLIADNARGIFLEGSYRNLFRGNVIAESDVAIVLYDSCAENRFVDNLFVANMTPLSLVGRRTDTNFDGNYWSGNDEPDLDGDLRSDRPYRLSSVFDHFRGNLTAADLFTSSLAASALSAAERAFPVLEAVAVEDRSPLARPPALAGGPPSARARSRPKCRRAGGLRGGGGPRMRRGLERPPMIRFRRLLEDLRPASRGRRADLRRRGRRGRRAARPQRLGKDDDAQGGRRADSPVGRGSPGRRTGALASAARGAPGRLLPAPEGVVPRRRHGSRGGRVLPAASQRRRGEGGPGPPLCLAQRRVGPAHLDLLRRHAPATGPGRRGPPGEPDPPPRRADGGPRPRRTLRLLRPRRPATARGPHPPLHVAPARRRRAARRPLSCSSSRGASPPPSRSGSSRTGSRSAACCGCGSSGASRDSSSELRAIAPGGRLGRRTSS